MTYRFKRAAPVHEKWFLSTAVNCLTTLVTIHLAKTKLICLAGPALNLLNSKLSFWLPALERTPLFDIVSNSNGFTSYLHISSSAGLIEVGWITMSPLIQLSVMSTEAMNPITHFIFNNLGYRR